MRRSGEKADMKRKILLMLVMALLLLLSLSTVAWCDESDITVEAGPGYEILDVTVEESYDETIGQTESLTILYAPVDRGTDPAAVAIYVASAIFLAVMVVGQKMVDKESRK